MRDQGLLPSDKLDEYLILRRVCDTSFFPKYHIRLLLPIARRSRCHLRRLVNSRAAQASQTLHFPSNTLVLFKLAHVADTLLTRYIHLLAAYLTGLHAYNSLPRRCEACRILPFVSAIDLPARRVALNFPCVFSDTEKSASYSSSLQRHSILNLSS